MAAIGGVSRAKTTSSSTLLIVGLIIHIQLAHHLTMSNPVPLRSDIISGQDFLSLFMPESPPQVNHQHQQIGSSTQNSSSYEPEAAIPDAIINTTSAYDDDEEGDIGNEIISLDPSKESPTLTTLVTTTSTAPPNRTPSEGADRSARTLSSSSIASNKRVIVRKLINVQRNGRTKLNASSTVLPLTSSITTTTTTDANLSGDTNYLEDEKMQLNSHRSELFIDEADAKDLLNSESMNVPRIAQLPVLLQQSSLVKTTSSTSSSSSSQLDANDGVHGTATTDNGNLQRNSPFTLQRRPPVAAIPSSSSNKSARATSDVDDYDQEANASNNDQLVQERRMSTSRSRSQGTTKPATESIDVPAAAPQAPPPSPSYQTVVYEGSSHHHQQAQPQPASPIRLPVPRSISYGSLAQKVDTVVPGNKFNWNNFPTIRRQLNETGGVNKGAAVGSSPPYQAKVYSEPAKVYSEPARVYSEPAKVYSEPAKVYSEPAKFYSEPAKVYSEPARNYGVPPTPFPVTTSTTTMIPRAYPASSAAPPSSAIYQLNRRVLFNLDKLPYDLLNAPNRNLNLQPNSQPVENEDSRVVVKEKNNVEEIFYDNKKGDTSGPTGNSEPELVEEEEPALEDRNPTDKGDNSSKTGYVVEGRHYRKYRVEEKTPDGFIVGEYGVVTGGGHLRGVRYTADSNINPRLIYDALLKFLSL